MDKCHVSSTRYDLEVMLINEDAEPKRLPFSLLAEITSNFSEDNIIGRGGFATVYKGSIGSRKVAVKRLLPGLNLDEEVFRREVECLMKVKHRNIIRFLGYCYETKGKLMNARGIRRPVMAHEQERLLCFQYLPNGGLDKYITDASSGFEWEQRYQIINGVCQGLHRLHKDYILHLDLKPENILLDDDMVPKISDFGLSRCLEENQTRLQTINIGGTWEYMAPELKEKDPIIRNKCDFYSLGAIIMELLTGTRKSCTIDNVIDGWIKRLGESQINMQLLDQIKVCAQIGIMCSDPDPWKRPPDTKHIIDMLEKLESAQETQQSASNKLLLQVHPTLLVFELQPGKLSPCPVQLTNDTDEQMAFKLSTTLESVELSAHFSGRWPVYGIVAAQSTYTLILTVLLEKDIPENRFCDMILESCCTTSDLLSGWYDVWKDSFNKSAKPKNAVKVTAFLSSQHRQSIISTPTGPGVRISWMEKPRTRLYSVDAHLTKPWIIDGHECGRVSIRNHDTQKLLHSFKVSLGPVWSVKFIARKQWFICSSAEGLIHVYTYETEEMRKIKTFRAYDKGERVSLAVHPIHSYVMSWRHSPTHRVIKVWDWDKGWECTHTFEVNDYRVLVPAMIPSDHLVVAFDPKVTNRFATASYGSVMVWSLDDAPESLYRLPRTYQNHDVRGDVLFLEIFTSGGRLYMIVIAIHDMTADIWDMEHREFVTEKQRNPLSLEASDFSHHPNLHIRLAPSYFLDAFCLWSPKDFSLQGIVHNYVGGPVRATACLMGSKTRFVIGQEDALTVLHIDNGTYQEDPMQTIENADTRQEDTSSEVITQGPSKRLNIHLLNVHFSFQDDELIPCLLHLTNNTEKHVAFMPSSPTEEQPYKTMRQSGGIVPPRSMYTMDLNMSSEEQNFSLILQSSISGDRYIYTFANQVECDQFFEDAKETGNLVEEVLKAALSQTSPENGSIGQDVTKPLIKIRGLFHAAIENDIHVLDVDPTESWIITGHGKGDVFIRDFDTQQMIYSMNNHHDVCSVKIIARKQWVVVGTRGGFIHVYEYGTGITNIKTLKAKSSELNSYGKLAIHPTLSYVLSTFDDKMQLWDWDKGWQCVQTFEREHTGSVHQVAFSPKDTNAFASASRDLTVKIWSLSSRTSEYTLHGHCDIVNCLDFFTGDDAQQYLISGSQDCTAKIWGLKEKKCVHTMDIFMSPVVSIISLPDSPYITTGSEDGTVHLWSSVSFRLERIINIGGRGPVGSLCLMGSKRVVIKKMGKISAMDMDSVSMETQQSASNKLMLQVHPTLLEFELQPGKLSPCPLQLTNDTDKHMIFKLSTTSECEDWWKDRSTCRLPWYGFVAARSTYTLILTVLLEQDIPENRFCDMILESRTTSSVPCKVFDGHKLFNGCEYGFNKSLELNNAVKLRALLSAQHTQSIISTPTRLGIRISSMKKLRTLMLSMDAHPTKQWIITGHECGGVGIWNHDTQTLLHWFEVSSGPVWAVKFIARKEWFICSSAEGLIHVYSYETEEIQKIKSFNSFRACRDDSDRVYVTKEIQKIKSLNSFRACRDDSDLVSLAYSDRVSLAVHPTLPYVMSWWVSRGNHEMKLWDWDKGRECAHTSGTEFSPYDYPSRPVIAFDPKVTNRFATASLLTVKVWSLDDGAPEPQYDIPPVDSTVISLEFFTRYGRQYLIIIQADTSEDIWDMQLEKFFTVKQRNSLPPEAFDISHPNLPILLAPSSFGACRFWSPKDFRLWGVLDNYGGGYVCGVACLMESKRRFVIGQEDALTILHIDNGTYQEDSMQSIEPQLYANTTQRHTNSEDFIASTILDHPDWQGLDDSSKLRCHHNRPPRKKVCWDGKDTGRRFFGCYELDETLQCSFIHWVDNEWPASVQWAMKELWEEIKKNRKTLNEMTILASALADAQEKKSALASALADAQKNMSALGQALAKAQSMMK